MAESEEDTDTDPEHPPSINEQMRARVNHGSGVLLAHRRRPTVIDRALRDAAAPLVPARRRSKRKTTTTNDEETNK